MGVDRTDYLMFGVDVGADSLDWDKHQAEVEGSPAARFDIVNDGMSGEYCIAGKIIARSEPYDGFARARIDAANLEIDKAALAAKISEAFGRTIAADDLALILFSHFS